jgi:hypothetical protein
VRRLREILILSTAPGKKISALSVYRRLSYRVLAVAKKFGELKRHKYAQQGLLEFGQREQKKRGKTRSPQFESLMNPKSDFLILHDHYLISRDDSNLIRKLSTEFLIV